MCNWLSVITYFPLVLSVPARLPALKWKMASTWHVTRPAVSAPECTGLACNECADGFFMNDDGFCLPCEDGTKPGTDCDKQTGDS